MAKPLGPYQLEISAHMKKGLVHGKLEKLKQNGMEPIVTPNSFIILFPELKHQALDIISSLQCFHSVVGMRWVCGLAGINEAV